MKKIAVCLLTRAMRSGVSAWRDSARHQAAANAGQHRRASGCFSCVQRGAGIKTREANARESLTQKKKKKPFGLAQLYLRVSRPIQPVSRRDPSPEKQLFSKYMHHWLLLILKLDSF